MGATILQKYCLNIHDYFIFPNIFLRSTIFDLLDLENIFKKILYLSARVFVYVSCSIAPLYTCKSAIVFVCVCVRICVLIINIVYILRNKWSASLHTDIVTQFHYQSDMGTKDAVKDTCLNEIWTMIINTN